MKLLFSIVCVCLPACVCRVDVFVQIEVTVLAAEVCVCFLLSFRRHQAVMVQYGCGTLLTDDR